MDTLTKILIMYMIAINIITYIAFAFDKARSRGRGLRVSEKKLWFLSLIGGSIGALLAMNQFRHKTKKLSFQAGLAAILAVQVWVIYTLVHHYG